MDVTDNGLPLNERLGSPVKAELNTKEVSRKKGLIYGNHYPDS